MKPVMEKIKLGIRCSVSFGAHWCIGDLGDEISVTILRGGVTDIVSGIRTRSRVRAVVASLHFVCLP